MFQGEAGGHGSGKETQNNHQKGQIALSHPLSPSKKVLNYDLENTAFFSGKHDL